MHCDSFRLRGLIRRYRGGGVGLSECLKKQELQGVGGLELDLQARSVAWLINIARTFENFLPQLPESSSVGKYIGFVRLSPNYLENRSLCESINL